MSDDEKEDGPAIYKVETIPPPDGEDDAYSAPTKVGPMADAAVRELMQAAERKAAELTARNAEKKAASAAAAKVAASLPTPMSVKPTGIPQTPASSKPPAPASSGSDSGSPSASSTPSASSVPSAWSVPSAAPPSPRAAPSGPVSGRSPAPPVGPVGRTVPAAPSMSPKPPSLVPRPAAIPRVDAVIATPAPIPTPPPPAAPPPPALPVMTMEPGAIAALSAEPLPPAVPVESGPHTPPRLYDEKDETDDAATLLHKSAAQPRQEHTALLPSAGSTRPPPVAPNRPSARPREPIPFDRAIAVPVSEPEPPRVLLMPLVVGFLIFAIGLGFYIWAR